MECAPDLSVVNIINMIHKEFSRGMKSIIFGPFSFSDFFPTVSAVSNAHVLLQDQDKVKKVHEILEEARAMVKATVS